MRRHGFLFAAFVIVLGCDPSLPPPPPRVAPSAPAPSVAPTLAAPSPVLPLPHALPQPEAPAPTEAAGVRYVTVLTGGATAGERLPMVVAVHGLGDTPEAFATVFQGFSTRARVIVVRGLDPYYDGFAWFPSGSADRLPNEFRRASDALARALPVLAAQHPSCGLPVVTGFSQGAMLSWSLVTRRPSIVRGAVPVAGRLPPAFWPGVEPLGGLLPQVFALHGTADDRIDIQTDRDTAAHARAAGFGVTLREYPGVPHTITAAMQRDLFDALTRMLAGPC